MQGKELAFWARYAGFPQKYGVFGKNAQWHVRRAQAFAYGLQGVKLGAVSSAYLDACLEELGRNPEMEARQVR